MHCGLNAWLFMRTKRLMQHGFPFPVTAILFRVLVRYVVFAVGAAGAHVPNFKPKKLNLANSLQNYKNMLRNPTFWTMGGPFAMAMGAGMFITNNTTSMVGATLPYSNATSTDDFTDQIRDGAYNLNVIFSIIGTIARLAVGRLIRWYPKYPASIYLTGSCVLTCIGLVVYAAYPTLGTLYALYVFAALGVGSLWTPCITMLKMFAPVEAFGQSFGLMCCLPAIVGFSLNKISADIYDEFAKVYPFTGSTPICVGPECFKAASYLAAGACAIAAVWSSRLLNMTREDAHTMHTAMKGKKA